MFLLGAYLNITNSALRYFRTNSSWCYCNHQLAYLLLFVRNHLNSSDQTHPICVGTTCSFPLLRRQGLCKPWGTLHHRSSDHKSFPRRLKPSHSLGVTKPAAAASVPGSVLPALIADKAQIPLSTSHHSSLLPQKSKFSSSERKMCGQNNKGH